MPTVLGASNRPDLDQEEGKVAMEGHELLMSLKSGSYGRKMWKQHVLEERADQEMRTSLIQEPPFPVSSSWPLPFP